MTQTVMVTGATSGIGEATARAFAAEGYRVIITGRRASRLQKLKVSLEATGAQVELCATIVLAVRRWIPCMPTSRRSTSL